MIEINYRSDATQVITDLQFHPKGVFISFDYTPDQREKYKKLKRNIVKFINLMKKVEFIKLFDTGVLCFTWFRFTRFTLQRGLLYNAVLMMRLSLVLRGKVHA